MKTKPILFSTDMVRAILAREKTQTRRIIKSRTGSFNVNMFTTGDVFQIHETDGDGSERGLKPVHSPYGYSGGQLWVRETWTWEGDTKYTDISPIGNFYYKADFPDGDGPTKWKPSIFMPREACRVILDITEVRVERLHDISEEDAKSEGAGRFNSNLISESHKHRYQFRDIWFKINGEESWEKNPWVWVITFKKPES